MEIKIISKSGRIPKYETEGSAGFDLAAYTDKPIILLPGERKLIPTGIFMEFPKGYEAEVRARSGLAIKNGIGLVNGVGTVDSDYRGEFLVPIINWGDKAFTINDGDRIAQVVISKYEQVGFKLTDTLEDTHRGKGGFGHTGV